MIQAPKSVGTTPADVSAFYAAIAAGAPGIEIVLQERTGAARVGPFRGNDPLQFSGTIRRSAT